MYGLVKLLVRIPLRIAFNLHYEGRENIPKNEAVIYASNHRTNADPPLAGCGARGSLTFMAKEELFRNKLFGGLISAVGAFPVSRGKGDTSAIDRSLENLKNGKCLIIDAKLYSRTLVSKKGYDKQSFVSSNLYQLFTYDNNYHNTTGNNVSGALLYAKTDEDLTPHEEFKLSGNRYVVTTLDLNQEFDVISKQLDDLVLTFFEHAVAKHDR